MIFPEAVTELSMYRKFVEAVKVPVLANITEFGSTPMFTVEELDMAGVSLVLRACVCVIMPMDQIINLDRNDDILKIHSQVEWSGGRRVILVVPRGARALDSLGHRPQDADRPTTADYFLQQNFDMPGPQFRHACQKFFIAVSHDFTPICK